MKKLLTILASLLILTGFSYATTIARIQEKKTTEKKAETKADKKEVKKVPAKKTADKKAKTK
jgi:hypothetical protein